MIRLFVFLVQVFWFFPVVILEVIFILIQRGQLNAYFFVNLILALVFGYLFLNLRRDRLDLMRYNDIINYLKYFRNCKYSLISTSSYIPENRFEEFRKSYFTSYLTKLSSWKINHYLKKRIRIIFIEPDFSSGKKVILPEGLKVFPSLITQETIIVTTDRAKNLNPLRKFYIFHELGHIHPRAMLPIVVNEVHMYPFLWLAIWLLVRLNWSFFPLLSLILLGLLVLIFDSYLSVKGPDKKMRLHAEVAADYTGLKLLTEEERKHPVFNHLKIIDPGLSEEENEIRVSFFNKMKNHFDQKKEFKLPEKFPFPRILLLFALTSVIIIFFMAPPSMMSIKCSIALCAILQLERFTNVRRIIQLKLKIKELAPGQWQS